MLVSLVSRASAVDLTGAIVVIEIFSKICDEGVMYYITLHYRQILTPKNYIGRTIDRNEPRRDHE